MVAVSLLLNAVVTAIGSSDQLALGFTVGFT